MEYIRFTNGLMMNSTAFKCSEVQLYTGQLPPVCQSGKQQLFHLLAQKKTQDKTKLIKQIQLRIFFVSPNNLHIYFAV